MSGDLIKALILFAHPAIHKSRVNRVMIERVRDLEGVLIHDLYTTYPDFFIDIETEQKLLRSSELIIFHHPMYWYSSPALLKEWQDVVLERGFAYGTGGTALKGKHFMSVISTGGKATAYCEEGYNRFTVMELLRPYHAMANLCGMHYHQPLLIQGTYERTEEAIEIHASQYREFMKNYLSQGPSFLKDPESEEDGSS